MHMLQLKHVQVEPADAYGAILIRERLKRRLLRGVVCLLFMDLVVQTIQQ